MKTTRREFIRLAAGLALASLGRHAGADDTALPAGTDREVLSDLVYQLFPHPGLGRDLYQQVAEQLHERIDQSEELVAMLDNAMEVLAGGARENWFALSQRGRVEALGEIQHTPFFQFVLNETLGLVYRHPLTWELLGYEGSSLEFGGYIDRGFDDIDWLPGP